MKGKGSVDEEEFMRDSCKKTRQSMTRKAETEKRVLSRNKMKDSSRVGWTREGQRQSMIHHKMKREKGSKRWRGWWWTDGKTRMRDYNMKSKIHRTRNIQSTRRFVGVKEAELLKVVFPSCFSSSSSSFIEILTLLLSLVSWLVSLVFVVGMLE